MSTHTAFVGRRLQLVAHTPAVPSEPTRSLALGLTMHLGPAAAFVAITALVDKALVPTLTAFVAINFIHWLCLRHLERAAPDVDLPRATRQERIEGFSLVVLKGVVVGALVVLGTYALATQVLPSLSLGATWGAIAFTVLATDFVYYCTHRWLGHGRGAAPLVRWFRRNHRIHHTVEHLDFVRGNVSSTMDTAVTGFQVPAGIIAVLLGLDLTGTLIAYGLILMLQATHHLNHTLNIGIARFVFMDNHAHKLHHCRGGMLVNHGALFSLWDLAFGTYYEDHRVGSNHLHLIGGRLPIRWSRNA